MKAIVTIRRRGDIADPQGTTVARALTDLGFEEVRGVRVDRQIILDLDDGDREAAEARVRLMCEQLLVNPVMDDYEIEFA